MSVTATNSNEIQILFRGNSQEFCVIRIGKIGEQKTKKIEMNIDKNRDHSNDKLKKIKIQMIYIIFQKRKEAR